MKTAVVYISVLALLFAACSDDAANEKIVEVADSGMDVVDEVSMLPPCKTSNNGEMVWVKNELTPRMCSDGKWYAIAEGSVAATCRFEPLADGGGKKVVCGGDSIGVLLNGLDGKDGSQGKQGEKGETGDDGDAGSDGKSGSNGKNGTDGKDGADGTPGADGRDGSNGRDGENGTSCTLKKIDEQIVRVICGNDSTDLYAGELPDSSYQDTVVLDSEKIAISLDEVSGISQKGPFLNGSTVFVRELEDGRTLTQTGNSFNGKILNDKGEFQINARMLVSQYVMLEASGYYKNEVTGENSKSALTLFAITDVNDRNTVNVNLLTHLEYERVIYLVTKKKMKVREAKKQAQKEILAAFNIDASNFRNSEDLNIAGNSEEDAALLAFSIALQGDRSESELSELLTQIATSMETSGIWSARSVANWVAAADSSGRFPTIRRNVERWNLSKNVPDFEKYLRRFWAYQFGLLPCTDANVGEVAAPWGKTSTRRFTCGEKGYWRVSTDFEKDTYGWNDTTDGALRKADFRDTMYVFDSLGVAGHTRGWRLATEFEQAYGGCNKSLYGEFRQNPNRRYIVNGVILPDPFYLQCQESAHDWVMVDDEDYRLEIDTQGWGESTDGDSRLGDSIGVVCGGTERYCYVYDTSAAYKGWRKGDWFDCGLGIPGCTESYVGRVLQGTQEYEGNYYGCVHYMDTNEKEFVYRWRRVADDVVKNVGDMLCLDSNEGKLYKDKLTDAYFVCENNLWRNATSEEEDNCRDNGVCRVNWCTSEKFGKFDEQDGITMVCKDGEWRKANCAELKTQSVCSKALDSTVVWDCEDVGGFKMDYVCYADNGGRGWHGILRPDDYPIAEWHKVKAKYYTQEMHPDAEYGADLVDARDGEVYKTVVIGGKHWMAENLRYMDSTSSNLIGQVRCPKYYTPSYTYAEHYCEAGRFYNWTAAMNVDPKWGGGIPSIMQGSPHRGVCPEGWHIPDTTEWKQLYDAAGSSASLLATGYTTLLQATDASGFSALPWYYSNSNAIVYFWSTSGLAFRLDDAVAYLQGDPGEYVNVRCVEDD